MRRVCFEGDWCAQCGTPIDLDSGEYCSCDVYDRRAGVAATIARGIVARERSRTARNRLSLRVRGWQSVHLRNRTVRRLCGKRDGLCRHSRLGQGRVVGTQRGGINILDMSELPALKRIVEGVPEYGVISTLPARPTNALVVGAPSHARRTARHGAQSQGRAEGKGNARQGYVATSLPT